MDIYNGSGKKPGCLTRRQLLKSGVCAAALSIVPYKSFANKLTSFPDEKKLNFYNIHTGESLKAMYCSRGEFIEESLKDINYIMRDYRTNEIKKIDVRLLDLLYDIKNALDTEYAFHIVSGYRTAKTNRLLRKLTKGVSKNSLHMHGKAVDIRVPYQDTEAVKNAAVKHRRGGVGYYPDSDFVHVDVGEIHYW